MIMIGYSVSYIKVNSAQVIIYNSNITIFHERAVSVKLGRKKSNVSHLQEIKLKCYWQEQTEM